MSQLVSIAFDYSGGRVTSREIWCGVGVRVGVRVRGVQLQLTVIKN